MFRFLCGCAFVALLVSSPVAAEEPYVTVTQGNLVGSKTVPSVVQVRQEIQKRPGAVAVVGADEFNSEYVVNLKDMLSNTPGVYAQPRFGEEVRLSIRGSGIGRSVHLRGVNILQDGVPINTADGSGDFQEIDPLILQHLEVYRGGNALEYGATTLGGAINAVTPSGLTAPHQYLLRMEGGSFGTLRTHASTAQQSGSVDVYAAATKTVANGFRLQSETDNQRFSGNIGIQLNDDVETRFYMAVNDLKQDIAGAITRREALATPEFTPAANITRDNSRDIKSYRLSNKTSFDLGSGWQLDAGAFLNKKDLYHPISILIDYQSIDGGAFGRLKRDYNFGGYRNESTLGLNYSKGHTDAFIYNNVNGKRGAKTSDGDQDSDNFILYGENHFYLQSDLALVLGGQAYRSTRDLTNNLVPTNSADKTFTGVSPKVGLLWNALPTAQVYANITKGAEVPTFSELVQVPVVGFVPLDTQKAVTLEIGSRGSYGRFSWDVAAYHADIDGELLQFTTTPDIPAATFNAQETTHQGIELGGEAIVAQNMFGAMDQAAFRLIYNYSDFHFDNDTQYGDNQLPIIPQHYVRSELRYTNPNGLTLSPYVEWVPTGPYVDYANTADTPSYATFNMNASYKMNQNVEFFIDGRNLTDEKYISNFTAVTNAAMASPNLYYPGDGRGVFSGFKVSF